MTQRKSIMICMLAIALSSCKITTGSRALLLVPTPDIGVAVQTENSMELTAPNGWNSFKTNKPISLEIRNISKKQIVLEQDFSARIFVYANDEWIEVKNKEVYTDHPFVLEPNENYDPLKNAVTIVRPDLPDYSLTHYIRIYVFGNLIESKQQPQEVTSFIDLKLTP